MLKFGGEIARIDSGSIVRFSPGSFAREKAAMQKTPSQLAIRVALFYGVDKSFKRVTGLR
jgi:hypothetical protein